MKDSRNNTITNEWGQSREFSFKNTNFFSYLFYDSWRSKTNPENPLYASSFTANLWRRKSRKSANPKDHINHLFQLFAPRIDHNHVFCICGDDNGLGNWKRDQAIIMDDSELQDIERLEESLIGRNVKIFRNRKIHKALHSRSKLLMLNSRNE